MRNFLPNSGWGHHVLRPRNVILMCLLPLFFVQTTPTCKAAFGAVIGEIHESVANFPITGARIQLVLNGQTKNSTVTNSSGQFRFHKLFPGNYELRINANGYKPLTQKIRILPYDTLHLKLNLEIDPKDVEVNVETRSKPQQKRMEEKLEKLVEVKEMYEEIEMLEEPMAHEEVFYEMPMEPEPEMLELNKEMETLPRLEERMEHFNTEAYDPIQENDFQPVSSNPLSTFSIDVDAASYSNARRMLLHESRLPPAGAVRIEEFINYFSYDYPQPAPTARVPFTVNTELGPCPWNPTNQLVHIGLQGRKMDLQDLPQNNIVFLLDVSGSMDYANKLPLVKRGLHLLVEQMRPEDRVSIVVYAGAAGLVLPPTPGNQKAEILSALDRLEAGGSTAGGEGIRLAYDIAQKHFDPQGNNRVILCTDGDFNVGMSSDDEMVRLIEEKRESGVYLTVLGFGNGNYKDSKMEKLADNGNGNYAYIDNVREAKKVFVNELGATLLTIAKDVKLQIEFNPAQVQAYRLIGYENRVLRNRDFNDDKKDAGELGAGHTVTAIYEIVPPDAEFTSSTVDPLKYQETKPREDAASKEVITVKLRYKPPTSDKSELLSQVVKQRRVVLEKTSVDFRFSAAVAAFGMLLRGSEYSGKADYDMVMGLVRRAMDKDKEGYRAEFLRMVEAAALL
ncbi:MAG: von Willebrand factor type A domain-containing protein [Bacteroidota bacterium]